MANKSTQRGAPDSPTDEVEVKKEKLDDEEKKPEAREEDPEAVVTDAAMNAEDDNSGEDEGEFVTLISSDGKEVKAKAEVLRKESSVFRALLSLCESTIKRQAIKLTDSNIETFDVVAFAVKAVTLKDMKDGGDFPTRLVVNVLRFARKWDLAYIVQLHSDFLSMRPPSIWCSAQAMFTGFPGIAARQLRDSTRTRLGTETQISWPGWEKRMHERESDAGAPAIVPEHNRNMPGGAYNDLGCYSLDAFSSFPTTWVWAILRARAIAKSNGKGDDWKVIGDEFEKIAAAMYPTDGSKQ